MDDDDNIDNNIN